MCTPVIFYSNDILGKIIPTLAPYVSLLIAILNVLLTFPPIFLIEVSIVLLLSSYALI
jgi:SP family facilitated glucose transporter-like MFS transporter 3